MDKQTKLAVNLQQDFTEAEKAQGRSNLGLAQVASTGDYRDLSNTPAIPAAQEQSDWNQTDSSAVSYIRNKPSIGDGTLTIQHDGATVATFSANSSSDVTANIVTKQAYAIQQSRESYYPSSASWPVIGQLADDGATTVCSVKFPTDVVTKNITVSNTGAVTFQQLGVYHIHLEIPVEVTHAAEDTDATTNYVYASAAVYSTGSSNTKGWTETRGYINRRLSELNTYWVKVDLDAVVGDLDAVFSCEIRLHGLNLSTNDGMTCAVHKPIGSITRVC